MLAVNFSLFYACFNNAFLLVFMKYILEHSLHHGKKNNYLFGVGQGRTLDKEIRERQEL